MRAFGKLASAAERNVTTSAPAIEPVIEPRPPMTTMMRMLNDCINVNEAGLRMYILCPKSTPATPAKNAPMVNASTLYTVVFTPIDSAAISFSRIARHARPWREFTKFLIRKSVASMRKNTHVKFVRC